jgi:glycosyltransferase involved in cell wall biosynthesis
MRMAYVSADQGVPVFGSKGCSVHVQEVLRVLVGLGIEVDIFSPRIEGDPPQALERSRVHSLPRAVGTDRRYREESALAANENLSRALERQGPFDLIYERYSLWSFAAMRYARDQSIASVLEVNAPLIEEQAEHRGLCDRASAERVAEDVFADATILVAVSSRIAEYLSSYRGTEGRVHVVPNGVNPDCFRPGLAPACREDGVFTVGFVGNLRPWHGLEVLIESFARFHGRNPATRLLVVGDGPLRQSVEDDLAARGLRSSAHFTGTVPHDAVPHFLASLDVAVAPYPESSNFYFSPLKVYEYMAAGLPVVASRMGQLAEVIEHERTGLLCPAGDPAAFAEALGRLFKDPVLAQRLGAEARQVVLRKHTWHKAVKRILSLAQAAATWPDLGRELSRR